MLYVALIPHIYLAYLSALSAVALSGTLSLAVPGSKTMHLRLQLCSSSLIDIVKEELHVHVVLLSGATREGIITDETTAEEQFDRHVLYIGGVDDIYPA